MTNKKEMPYGTWIMGHGSCNLCETVGRASSIIEKALCHGYDETMIAAVMDANCLDYRGTYYELFCSAAFNYLMHRNQTNWTSMLGLVLDQLDSGRWCVVTFKNPLTGVDENAVYDSSIYDECMAVDVLKEWF